MLLVVSWGLGVMSVVFLFNLASVLTPYLDGMLSSTARPTMATLTMMLHPFPFSLLVASSAGIQISPIILLGSLMSIICYSGLVILAARWSFGRINSIGSSIDGPSSSSSSQLVGPSRADLRIIPRHPLVACIIKDLRVASRNPATGFLFALPIFETLAVILPLTSSQLVRTFVILVASAVAGGFALFVAFLLSNAEVVRMEYNDALPMHAITPIVAKTLSATISYLPAPIFLVLVAYGKTTDPAGFLVPVLMIMAVCAACLGEVTVLRKLGRKGRASLLNFGGGIAVGTAILLVPVLVYTIVFLGTRNHPDSIVACAFVAAAELFATITLVRRSV